MRKGHGSTKVPGVKLRPAAPQKVSGSASAKSKSKRKQKQKEQPSWLDSTGDDFDVTDIIKSSKKPFHGLVVSASGVADKATLLQKAVQLGAQASNDLTDCVTHLICNGPGSAKYQYCVQHGIPILRRSWIEDSHTKYLEGEDIDVQSSIEAHRLPIFASIQLCCTAVPEDSRTRIAELILQYGGTFLSNIERKTTMTHLLCGGERGENVDDGGDGRGWTPKMLYVEKLVKEGKAIKMVWEEWFWDCLEFKGLLNENDYSVHNPRPQRRKHLSSTPLVDPIPSSTDLNSALSQQRSRSIPPSIPNASLLNSGTDKEEMASVRRLPETTSILWKGLLKSRGIEVQEGKLKRSLSSSNAERDTTARTASLTTPVDESRNAGPSGQGQGSSLTAAFKRTKSFAVKTDVAEGGNNARALQRVRSTPVTTSVPEAGPSMVRSLATTTASTSPEPIPEGEKNLFFGKRFRLLGDADDPKVVEAIQVRGGVVLTDGEDSNEDGVDFRIVRLASGTPLYLSSTSESLKLKFRTECWIEQCIYEERLCARDEHPAFRPLGISTPVSGAERLRIHASGLTSVEKTMVVRLSRAIGAMVTDHLSRKNTHLLCPCASGPKFEKAKGWRIPVVTLEWLYAIVETGEVKGVEEFLVAPLLDSQAKPSAGGAGTGTAAAITDITNEVRRGASASTSRTKEPDVAAKSSSGSGGVTQSSSTETDESGSGSLEWKMNGLLPDNDSAGNNTPRKQSSLVQSKTRPTTPLRSPRKPSASIISEGNLARSPSSVRASARLGKVPSSATPSPLKIPGPVASGSSTATTAACVAQSPSTAATTTTAHTLSGESASASKVLKDAITSLLGKRNASSEDAVGGESGEAAKGSMSARGAKRARPIPRSKSKQGPFSRTTSSDNLILSNTTSSNSRTDFPLPLYIQEEPQPPETKSFDESIRVMYEDPSQKNEQRRLMSLVNNEPLEVENRKERKGVRRGSRVKGGS